MINRDREEMQADDDGMPVADRCVEMVAGSNPASVRFPERNDVPMTGFEYDRAGRPLGHLFAQETARTRLLKKEA